MNIFAQSFFLAQATDSANSAWYLNPNFLVFLALLISIPVCVFVGRLLAKSFRMPEVGWKISLLLVCIISSGLIFYGKSAEMSRDTNGRTSIPFKFGVDLRGGVTIIGQMNPQPGVPAAEQITIQKIIPQLKQRIDPSGVREIVIRGLGNDKMEVIIPDVEKEAAERIWDRLITAGQLLFRIVADEVKHTELFRIARETALNRERDVVGEADEDYPQGRKLGEWFGLAREMPKDGASKDLLPFKFLPSANHLIRDAQTGELIDMAEVPYDRGNLQRGQYEFNEWLKARDIVDVEILMVEPPNDRQNVEGKYITRVAKGFDQSANLRIEFSLKPQGGKRMYALTSSNQKVGDRYSLLGIVLDEKLQSAPRINDPIRNNGVIEGSFTQEEIDGYVAVLNSGKLDVALRKNWISMDQILSTLGEELKQKGLMAIGLSLMLVLVFMLFYYRFCGIVACFALLLNLIFTLTVLLLINVNLTLTGIAGLVLTIGMSVDANVLVFERIREELNRGSALRMAIRNGFDRATTTIVDANLTTLITAVILYVIGTDQLRSFSVTLIVGILMCMFTSIFCSRILFDVAERQRWITQLKMTQIVGNKLVNFIGMRRGAFVVSVLVIGIGLAAFFARGSGILDTDLAGGSTARVEFVGDTTVDEIKSQLDAAGHDFEGDPIRYSITQMADNDRAFKVDSSLPVIEDDNAETQIKLDEIIGEVFKGKLVMLGLDYDPNAIQLTKLARRVPLTNNDNSNAVQPPIVSPPSNPTNDDKKGSDDKQGSGNGNDPAGNSSDEDNAATKDADGGDNGQGNGQSLSSLVSPTWPLVSSVLSSSILIPQSEANQVDPPSKQDESEQDPGTELTAPSEVDPTTEQRPVVAGDKYVAKVPLQFVHPIMGLSVRSYIKEAAKSLGNVPIRDLDITIKADDIRLTEEDRSDKWNLELNVVQPEDANRVLATVKSKMAELPYFASSSGVGSQVARETQNKAIFAMLASLIGIVAYIWIRFQNVAFGLAAIVALVHDVLVVLGAIAISYWLQGALGFLLVQDFRISLSVIAALLTIIGYSLNDTIVVFDRIREVRGKRTDLTAEIINKSISQTLSRTILTSATTFVVVFILYLIGGESIHAFAFSLVIGVIVGTYSSIFVASPMLLWLMNRGVSVNEPEKT